MERAFVPASPSRLPLSRLFFAWGRTNGDGGRRRRDGFRGLP
jgi:hypothetical protein